MLQPNYSYSFTAYPSYAVLRDATDTEETMDELVLRQRFLSGYTILLRHLEDLEDFSTPLHPGEIALLQSLLSLLIETKVSYQRQRE